MFVVLLIVDDTGFVYLCEHAPQMEYLDISWCTFLSMDAIIDNIGRLSNLTHLDMRYTLI